MNFRYIPVALALGSLASHALAISVRWFVEEGYAGTSIVDQRPAIIVDLLVDTTSTSHFGSAGLFVDPSLLPGVTYFQHPATGDNGPLPESPLPHYFLEIDTRILTADLEAGILQGRMVGFGEPIIGRGGEFNVIWSDALPSAAEGRNLIARLSMFDVVLGSTPVAGFVSSVEQPDVRIPLPPIPVARIPEPAVVCLLVPVLLCTGRMPLAIRR